MRSLDGEGTELAATISQLSRQIYLATRSALDLLLREDPFLAEFGITARHYGALRRLDTPSSVSGAELARDMGMTSQAAQQILQYLASNGLVDRMPDPSNGRVVHSVLTARGRMLVQRSQPKVDALYKRMVRQLHISERRTLVALLQKCYDSIEKENV
jgi:DNA-binding MarR family transcriptional regulator